MKPFKQWRPWQQDITYILAITAGMLAVFGIFFTALAYAYTPFGEPKFWWEY